MLWYNLQLRSVTGKPTRVTVVYQSGHYHCNSNFKHIKILQILRFASTVHSAKRATAKTVCGHSTTKSDITAIHVAQPLANENLLGTEKLAILKSTSIYKTKFRLHNIAAAHVFIIYFSVIRGF